MAPASTATPGDGSGRASTSTTLSADAEAAVTADVPPGEVGHYRLSRKSTVARNGALTDVGSDIAFKGKYAFVGNYDGFTVFDLSTPSAPRQVTQVYCPGSQNDVSIYGNILVTSTDSRRTNSSCSSEASTSGTSYWEGIRVWNISDPTHPRYSKAVATQCGSHTNSLAPSKDGLSVFVYVSSYFPNDSLANCKRPHDKISVVKIPKSDLTAARVVSKPILFPNGGYTSPDGVDSYKSTSGCHDITTYAKFDLAAGACMGDGILMDISNRANPTVISRVRDTTNFAFWHSATFNNAGTKVVFTDELGGGLAATCTGDFRPEQGGNGIYNIVDRTLKFKSYYKIPRINTADENCVAHNGSLVPIPGKDIMVQSWYQGGISAFNFSDSNNPKEIAWYDRGAGLSDLGTWSSYYYNGYVYSSDTSRGFETFRFDSTIDSTARKNLTALNPQSQQQY
ncbi:hypothetical protein [Myceligenerans crystallogenes]|uniref:LVIVD repeat-containing protein n=1 Tax=Myceligenerans crystallogenes TaxID=316335 RepID=UPI0031E16801